MIDPFSLAKSLHLLAVIAMVGATLINGILHAHAKLPPPPQAVALLRAVMSVNHYVMTPAFVALPTTGVWLCMLTGTTFDSLWLTVSATFTIILILAFGAGLRVERAMLNIAQADVANAKSSLSDGYQKAFRQAAPIGATATLLSLATLTLMIFKPM